ncbi:pyrroline-5-carboxylate reductase [Oceanithermus sp.]|jgi:pyrroline-5-carboxylate reductase
MELVFVGLGKMGRSILEGVLAAEFLPPQQIAIVERDPAYTAELAEIYGVNPLTHGDIAAARRVLIALQPKQFPAVAGSISYPNVGYLSIMAGVSTARLAESLGTRRVVRAMPNLAATIRKSTTALTAPREAQEAGDLEFATGLFKTVGDAYQLPERLFDAFTGMAASAPAYIALVAEALADGGVKMGISRKDALAFAADVLIATGELMRFKHPAVIKDEVASPGGTTIHGLAALEEAGVRSALYRAVEEATKRGRALGEKE